MFVLCVRVRVTVRVCVLGPVVEIAEQKIAGRATGRAKTASEEESANCERLEWLCLVRCAVLSGRGNDIVT